MSNGENRFDLAKIGEAAAGQQVSKEHFLNEFNIE
jgi:hypothetical protein